MNASLTISAGGSVVVVLSAQTRAEESVLDLLYTSGETATLIANRDCHSGYERVKRIEIRPIKSEAT